LFNRDNLEKHQINSFDDLFFLFLPDFVIETPLHILLLLKKYETFNRLITMVQKHFEKFLQSEYINKIIDMFIYMSQSEHPLSLTTIYDRYANGDLIFSKIDPYDSDEDDPEKNELKDNCELFRIYLYQISHKILDSERFLIGCNFLTE